MTWSPSTDCEPSATHNGERTGRKSLVGHLSYGELGSFEGTLIILKTSVIIDEKNYDNTKCTTSMVVPFDKTVNVLHNNYSLQPFFMQNHHNFPNSFPNINCSTSDCRHVCEAPHNNHLFSHFGKQLIFCKYEFANLC